MTLPGGAPSPKSPGLADRGDDQAPPAGGRWLELFHGGDRSTLEGCYRQHFATVERAMGSMLGAADRETAIHEVFSRLIGSADLRRSFQGGNFAAWLAAVARHQAIDLWRKSARETGAAVDDAAAVETSNWEEATQARLLVERFRHEHLPSEWQGVFDLRFLQHLPQRQAAARLGLPRTTLVYRELRIRRLLRRFLLEGAVPSEKTAPPLPPRERPPSEKETP